MEKLVRLRYNDPAPDVEVMNTAGKKVSLSSFWQDHPVLLAFTRHFGCPHCKEMLDQLVQYRSRLAEAGLLVVAITQGSPAETLEFARRQAPGIVCLSDPERRAYRAYGLDLGNLWQILFAPEVLKGTARAREHGYGAELPPKGQDIRQMSGTFIIGKDGRIRLPYYYDNIADHAPVELLLGGVLSTNWDKPFDGPLA